MSDGWPEFSCAEFGYICLLSLVYAVEFSYPLIMAPQFSPGVPFLMACACEAGKAVRPIPHAGQSAHLILLSTELGQAWARSSCAQ